jgi:flavin reductase (DIM6/NTAB) family NADH-FMN oxidoreductase RutF
MNTYLTAIPSTHPRAVGSDLATGSARARLAAAPAHRVATAGRSDSDGFRLTLRTCSTGVTVVTSSGAESSCGVTVSAFTSVSLDPPLVLVCLNGESSAARTIEGNGVFAVNVLSADQESLARRFASPARPRGVGAFDGVAHSIGATRAPILDGVTCWLDCRLTDIHVAGDHVIVIGEVLDFAGELRREPLVFHAGRYRVVGDRNDQASPAGPLSLSPTYFA